MPSTDDFDAFLEKNPTVLESRCQTCALPEVERVNALWLRDKPPTQREIHRWLTDGHGRKIGLSALANHFRAGHHLPKKAK